MKDIFFDTNYVSPSNTAIKLLCFLLVLICIGWLVFFILSKLKLIREIVRQEVRIRHAFLWTLFIIFLIENVYIFCLFYFFGADFVNFSSWKFYLGVLPQLIIMIGTIVYFFIRRKALLKITNQNLAK